MAFDFLSSVFGKKKHKKETKEAPGAKEKKRLEPAGVMGWISDRFSKEIESERRRFSELSGSMLDMIQELRRIVEKIRHRSFEAGDRTYAAVNMIKDTWAKKALMSFSSYTRGIERDRMSKDKIDFQAFSDLHHDTVRLLNEIKMIPRQKIVLNRYFENESKRMAEIMKSIGELLDRIGESVKGKSRLQSVNEAKHLTGQLDQVSSETGRVSDDIGKAKADIEKKRQEISDMTEKVESIQHSDDWKELSGLDETISKSRAKREEIELSVSARLGSLKRVCKLYAHDGKDLGKEERKVLTDLSHSPLKTFFLREAGSMEAVLRRLRDDADSGGFSLSKKDAGKAGDLKDILVTGFVSRAKSGYEEAKRDEEEARKKKDSIKVISMKGESERALEKSKAELEILRRQESELGKRLREKTGELKEKKREIVDFVKRELGSEIELD